MFIGQGERSMSHDYPVDKLFDKLFRLLLAVIGLVPWAVGLHMDVKRRKEKKKRERRHNTNLHSQRATKGKAANASGQHSEDRHRDSSGDNPRVRD